MPVNETEKKWETLLFSTPLLLHAFYNVCVRLLQSFAQLLPPSPVSQFHLKKNVILPRSVHGVPHIITTIIISSLLAFCTFFSDLFFFFPSNPYSWFFFFFIFQHSFAAGLFMFIILLRLLPFFFSSLPPLITCPTIYLCFHLFNWCCCGSSFS